MSKITESTSLLHQPINEDPNIHRRKTKHCQRFCLPSKSATLMLFWTAVVGTVYYFVLIVTVALIDSRLLEVRLPAVKLAELHMLTSSWLGRRACTRKELESLVGHLGFACKVVQPEKTFLRHMLELLSVPKSACSFVRLNVSFRSNLLWWHTFLT